MDYRILDHSKSAVSAEQAINAVNAAIPALGDLHFDPDRYKASVDKSDGKYRVGFVDRNAVPGASLGNPGKTPAIQVLVDPRTMKVISVGPMR